mgnify:CR=1 FL=1
MNIFLFCLIPFLLYLSAFFSSTEAAIFHLPLLTIEKLAFKNARFKELLQRQKYLLTILFGNTLVNLAFAIVLSTLLLSIFKIKSAAYDLVSTLLGAYIVLLFGEICPKLYALKNAEKITVKNFPIIKCLYCVFYPVTKLFEKLLPEMTERTPLSLSELKLLISHGFSDGAITDREAKFISHILDLKDIKIANVMTTEMEVVSASEPVQKIIKRVKHSRIPVYEGVSSNIIGVLYIKDLIDVKDGVARDYMRKPVFIDINTSLKEMLDYFLENRVHIALVKKGGRVVGLITLDDIIETVLRGVV